MKKAALIVILILCSCDQPEVNKYINPYIHNFIITYGSIDDLTASEITQADNECSSGNVINSKKADLSWRDDAITADCVYTTRPERQWQKEADELRDRLYDMSERLAYVESHFRGHEAIAAKNGIGIQIIPCKLGKPHCIRDDKGIHVDHVTVEGFKRDGIYIDAGKKH